ncbi:unnamed protein product [Soboliphyme baturini]|uniref:E3 ubiquitin-protein ligase n=1 Tax=Soboliphyme baturini TaxID=241478 RepID=A0A183IXL7_9BILA|nr:unnamed protein product [Soboliphyme baturini]
MIEKSTENEADSAEEVLKSKCDEILKGPVTAETFLAINWALRGFWSKYLPNTFFLGPSPSEAGLKLPELDKLLMKPLAYVLCGDRGVIYEALTLKSRTSTAHQERLCGHQFSSGEATYTCRDCALDPTCVLCYECFSNSEHKNHKYRISTSSGSGYCDCGDKEAWKADPLCSIAANRQNRMQMPSTTGCLSDAMLIRMKVILTCVVKYCVDLLSWPKPFTLPPDLTFRSLSVPRLHDQYQTVLYNDESHSYDQVIRALMKAIDCGKEQAMMLATKVDLEGRTSVCFGTKAYCEKARNMIEQKTRDSGSPLRVETLRAPVFASQQFAQVMIGWLSSVCSELPSLVPVVCDILMNKIPFEEPFSGVLPDHLVVAEKLLLWDVRWWKSTDIV